MDCILGYHLNPMACGIAKFNLILAKEIAIPVLSVFDPDGSQYRSPLLSIKVSEFQEADLRALDEIGWSHTHSWHSSGRYCARLGQSGARSGAQILRGR